MELDLRRVIEQVSKDKGVSRETVIETLEKALVTAARRKFGLEREIEAQFNSDTGEVELFEFKRVVEAVTNPGLEITLEAARGLDPDVELDDGTFMITTPMEDFHSVQKKLQEMGVEPESAELQRVPNDTVVLPDQQALSIMRIVEEFEDDEDSQTVAHNLEGTEEVAGAMD